MSHSIRWRQSRGSLSTSLRLSHAFRRPICTRCAHAQRRSGLISPPVHRPSPAVRLPVSGRCLSTEKSQTPDELRTTIDNILLKAEFETNNDIRAYLRKWQQQNTTEKDPVRDPGASNANLSESKKLTGSMLNDGLAVYDEALVTAQANLDESADFRPNVDESHDDGDILEPGDLVGFYSGTSLETPAIYLRSVDKQMQFYTARGKWRISSVKEIDVVIKDFAPRELVNRLAPYLPNTAVSPNLALQAITEGGIPRSAAAPLMAMLRQFSAKERKLFRDNALRIDKLHSLVASQDERIIYTLPEIAAKALDISIEDVTPEALFMTRKAIHRFPFVITANRSSTFSNQFLVRSISFANRLDAVMKWVREHEEHLTRMALFQPSDLKDHPVQNFLQKARKLILKSRTVRSPTTMSNVGPSAQQLDVKDSSDGRVYQKVVLDQFDESEKAILEYLINFSIPPHRLGPSPARYAAVHLMRATGLYTAIDIQRESTPLLLQELGVFSAWENIYALDPLLGLPSHNIDASAEESTETAQIAARDHSKYQIDAMASTRVDWGNLPIYCIDDPDAKEIDDGISLEPVDGSEDTFWLRVHIANPTAFIPPEDPISKNAARQLTTVYLPERHYPMLPDELTKQSFSLAADRPTLTISAKVNTNGEVLETEITNGIARNVVYLTPAAVRNALGWESTKESKVYMVGRNPPPNRLKEASSQSLPLTEEQLTTFNTLRQIMANINAKWWENGALIWPDTNSRNLTIYSGENSIAPFSVDPAKSQWEGGFYQGDPSIIVPTSADDPYEVTDLSRKDLVALVMRFACHVAGRWSADRNVPLVYNGTYFHPEYPPLTPTIMKNMSANDWYRFAPPKGYTASSVLPHISLGVDAYAKATSPLRRYSDMVAHYQIEAALRYERASGKQFNGTEPDAASCLPFSTEKVDHLLEDMKARLPLISTVQTQSRAFWVCQFLFRAFYFGECRDLPETFPCLVGKEIPKMSAISKADYVAVYMADNLPFGIGVQLYGGEEFRDLEPLSTVEAKIIAVNMAKHVVEMEIVKKVGSWKRTGDWA